MGPGEWAVIVAAASAVFTGLSLVAVGLQSRAALIRVWNSEVQLTLVHLAGDKYGVRQDGEGTAMDVAVSPDPELGQVAGQERTIRRDRLMHGELVSFYAAPSMATSDDTIRVTYARQSRRKPTITWECPLSAAQRQHPRPERPT
jgi:hypothetical protein